MISKMKQLRINQWTLVLAACGIVGLATVAQADSVTNAPSASTVPAATNAPAATAVAPAAQPYGKKANVGFLRRLNEAFLEQIATPCYTPPDTNAPPSRAALVPRPLIRRPIRTAIGSSAAVRTSSATPAPCETVPGR